MKTYVINAENVVTVHASGEDVAMSADRQTFATLGEFEGAVKERALAELVALWNSLAGKPPFAELKPVAKFTDRKTAVRRLWTVLQRLEAPMAEVVATPESLKTGVTTRERGRKAATILALVRRTEGATVEEIATAVNWQRHSVRGFISGTLVKKMGLRIETFRRESGARVYRVAHNSR